MKVEELFYFLSCRLTRMTVLSLPCKIVVIFSEKTRVYCLFLIHLKSMQLGICPAQIDFVIECNNFRCLFLVFKPTLTVVLIELKKSRKYFEFLGTRMDHCCFVLSSFCCEHVFYCSCQVKNSSGGDAKQLDLPQNTNAAETPAPSTETPAISLVLRLRFVSCCGSRRNKESEWKRLNWMNFLSVGQFALERRTLLLVRKFCCGSRSWIAVYNLLCVSETRRKNWTT